MQFVPLGQIPIAKTKAYSIEKEMRFFLNETLCNLYPEIRPSSHGAKKKIHKKKNKLSNKKSKKKYRSPRKNSQKSTSARSKRRNDNSSQDKSISSSHHNAISSHPISEDKPTTKNAQEKTQINQQLNPYEYVNKNPGPHFPFGPNPQYTQPHHNHRYQQQNNFQNFCFFYRNVTKTFGTVHIQPNSKIPILTIYQIPVHLTRKEHYRHQNFRNNSTQFTDHTQHNYINPKSQYMYRCPTGLCQYQILNPQNIQTSILQHCENFHKNNIMKYRYRTVTNLNWEYISYPPNN